MQLLLLPAAAPSVSSGMVLTIVLLSVLPSLVLYVWTSIALARVFGKLGQAGWKAWIPFYNTVVFLRLGGLSGWLLLLLLIPFFGQVFVYVAVVTAAHRINEQFGHGAGMTVLAALLFPVWASVLGFGGAEAAGPRREYAFGAYPDAESALRSVSPEFGRPHDEPAAFGPRPDLVSPSAWIPPAVPAPEPAAPAAVPAPARDGANSPQWLQEFEAPLRNDDAIAEPTPEPEPAHVEPAPAQPEPEPVTSWWMPAPETPAVVRDAFVAEPDAFPEESGAVSAVYGSPVAGAPRAAASSVSAFRWGLADADAIDEETVIAARKRPAWAIELPDGTTTDLTAETVVLGRRPTPVHTAPGAQLVAVVEDTRTVSKNHALLRRAGEVWTISDLGSTNGVMIGEVELAPGQNAEITGEFLLGDARLRLAHRSR